MIASVAQLVKNPPAVQETWVRPLGWKDPLEGKGYPLQYSDLENSMDYTASLWGHRVHMTKQLFHFHFQFSSVQSLSLVRLFATPWIAVRQASLSITNSRSSLKLTSIQSVMPSSHLILCCPLLLLPQSLPASGLFPMSQLFSWGGQSTGVSALASFLPKNTRPDLL